MTARDVLLTRFGRDDVDDMLSPSGFAAILDAASAAGLVHYEETLVDWDPEQGEMYEVAYFRLSGEATTAWEAA